MKYYTKEWYYSGCKPFTTEDEHKVNKTDVCGVDYLLHDCKILSDTPQKSGEKFEINLDNKGGFTTINKIIFFNYIIKETCDIKNKYCIAEEIYQNKNGRYEYHFLLQGFQKRKMTLEYLTINCERIVVV